MSTTLLSACKSSPEWATAYIKRLQRIEASVLKENRGQLRANGCVLCGANRSSQHTCGLTAKNPYPPVDEKGQSDG